MSTPARTRVRFPEWVQPRANQAALTTARNRLMYLIRQAALERSEGQSVCSLAEKLECVPSSLYNYIRAGKFGPKMAQKIEVCLGRDYIKAEWLMDPMKIPVAK